MDWYETLKVATLIIGVLEIFINYSYYKSVPVFNADPKQIYQFKSIWHRRLNRLANIIFIICAIAIIAHWIKALI